MIGVRFDQKSDLVVRWPRREADIVALAVAYVRRETNLPDTERLVLPLLSDIENLLTEAQQHEATADAGEMNRADAAQIFNETLSKVKEQLRVATVKLKAKYLDHLAHLELWGLDTLSGTRGIRVRVPERQEELIKCLNTYIAREQSLPETERVATPSLAEMEALAQTLATANQAREDGRQAREMGIERRKKTLARLLPLLQTAAINLVVTRFEVQVTEDLGQWGYQVVTRSKPHSDTPPDATEGAA